MAVVLTTGYDSSSKFKQFLLRVVLVTPPLIWVLRQKGDSGSKARIWIAPFFLLAAGVIISSSWMVRHGIYDGDESAYRFESKIIQSLHKTYAQAPPMAVYRDFVYEHHVMYRGRWFGKYPPGWPSILALGSSVLPGWLVNPLLGLILLWLVYVIAKEVYGAYVAKVAIVFMACSPFFLFNCVGFMSHASCAVFVALSTFFLLRRLATGRPRDLILMFVALAGAFLIRPFAAACAGLALVVVFVGYAERRRTALYQILFLGAPIISGALLLLLYNNAVLTDYFWRSPYALYAKAGLPPELQLSAASVARQAFKTIPTSLARTELHSFPFVLLLAGYAVIKRKSCARTMALLAVPLSLILGHLLMNVEVSSSFVGERYYFEGYFSIVALAAAGWEQLRENWKPSRAAIRAAVMATACLVTYSLVYVAHASVQYRRGYARIYETAESMPGDRILVFVERSKYVNPHNFNPNMADWENARVLFAVDPGRKDRSVGANLLHRPKWFAMAYQAQSDSVVIDERGSVAEAQSIPASSIETSR
jgi:hypothetical protein